MRWTALLVLALTAGCARLDHVQIGSIDQSQGELVPVSVRLSETGFDATAAAEIGRIASRGRTAENFKQLRDILALINMGPRTGNPVFDDTYAQRLQEYLLVECPGGRLTGIRAIREAKSAGPVSGEIVGVDAYCIR
ncbi:MAG: hypothetical protein LRY66_05355 [Saccharospirillaceae bacterium]|nr:hypothetical protein [Saccharospirillaceae bacterium]MCD8530784.1 hypothetical protein [Saccharospirillaceae bacterium]